MNKQIIKVYPVKLVNDGGGWDELHLAVEPRHMLIGFLNNDRQIMGYFPFRQNLKPLEEYTSTQFSSLPLFINEVAKSELSKGHRVIGKITENATASVHAVCLVEIID